MGDIKASQSGGHTSAPQTKPLSSFPIPGEVQNDNKGRSPGSRVTLAMPFPSIGQWDFMVRLRLQLREQLRGFTGFPIQPIWGTFVAVSLYMVLNFYIITKSCSFTIDQFEICRKDFLGVPEESEKGSSRWRVFRRNLSICSYFLIRSSSIFFV